MINCLIRIRHFLKKNNMSFIDGRPPDVNIELSLNAEPLEIKEVYEMDWNMFPTDVESLTSYHQTFLDPHAFGKYIIPQYSLVSSDQRHRTSIYFDAIKELDSELSEILIKKVLVTDLINSKIIKKSNDEYIKAKFELLK